MMAWFPQALWTVELGGQDPGTEDSDRVSATTAEEKLRRQGSSLHNHLVVLADQAVAAQSDFPGGKPTKLG